MKFVWKYGENEHQKYYDAEIGNDYLCVFANDWNPDTWMGFYNSTMIHNKTKNDRQRRKQGLPLGCHPSELSSDYMLASNDPEYMMRKVEHCYRKNKIEVCQ